MRGSLPPPANPAESKIAAREIARIKLSEIPGSGLKTQFDPLKADSVLGSIVGG
jgi:hypothetical protein